MGKIFCAVLLSALASQAFAAPPSEASLDAYFAAMNLPQNVTAMAALLDQAIQQRIQAATQGKDLSEGQVKALNDAKNRFSQLAKARLNWESLRPIYIQVYKEVFTQEEIDGLIAFYRSPAGVAYVNKVPLVMKKSIEVVQARANQTMAEITPDLDKAIVDARDGAAPDKPQEGRVAN